MNEIKLIIYISINTRTVITFESYNKIDNISSHGQYPNLKILRIKI